MSDSVNDNIISLTNELSITKSQLSSKCHAILILKQQLEDAKKEANQFKVLSEQLQERYRNLRNILDSDIDGLYLEGSQMKILMNLQFKLNESEMKNRILLAEINHLRKRNSDLIQDRWLRHSEDSPLRLETKKKMNFFESKDREFLISQLELKTIECERLKKELAICSDEKQELLPGVMNISNEECGSARCKALYQENQMLTRHICRLEADKKLLTQSLAKYLDSSSPSNVISHGSSENEPRDSPIITLSETADKHSGEPDNDNKYTK